MAKPALVISLKSIAICFKENGVAVAFIEVLKTVAKVLYRKRFGKKILKIYLAIFEFKSEWSLCVSYPFSRHTFYPNPEASGRDATAVGAKREAIFVFVSKKKGLQNGALFSKMVIWLFFHRNNFLSFSSLISCNSNEIHLI